MQWRSSARIRQALNDAVTQRFGRAVFPYAASLGGLARSRFHAEDDGKRMRDILSIFYPENGAGGFSRCDGTVQFYQRVHALPRPGYVVFDFGAGRDAAYYRSFVLTEKPPEPARRWKARRRRRPRSGCVHKSLH
jgi:hypothetical protein